MRYLVQFLVPALIFAGVVYLLTRRRSQPERNTREREDVPRGLSDTTAFIVVLITSAVVALGVAYIMQPLWE